MRPLLLWLFCASSLAAVPPTPTPSAGVVERQIEQEYEGKVLEPERRVPVLEIDIPEERLRMPLGRKVFIRQVRIRGNASVGCQEIAEWIRPQLGCDMAIADIEQLCRTIDGNYVRKGYFIARAYAPEQRVRDGVLRIQVVEGRLGDIKVVGNEHYSERFVRRHFVPWQKRALQYDEFFRALSVLNEYSDLVARAVFEKGQKRGTADVIIQVKDGRPLHLYLNGNNYGRNLTTDVRGGERLDAGNLFREGDMFSLAGVVGLPVNALWFVDAVYTIPLNSKGTELELAYLFSRFHIEELTSLRLAGRSDIATVKVSHALERWRTLGLDLFASFDYEQFQNFTLSQRTSYDKLRVLTVGMLLDGSFGGRDTLSVRVATGIPNFLGGMRSVSSHSSRVGAGGRFTVFNVDYDRIQPLPWSCFLFGHASGQWSPYKLTVPEQIYIGGMGTIRGYPLAVALGDSGYYLNLEAHFPPPFFSDKFFFKGKSKCKERVQLVAFVDQGGAFLQSVNNTFLWGAGLGVRVQGPYMLGLSADVGFPLNHRSLAPASAFFYLKITGQPF